MRKKIEEKKYQSKINNHLVLPSIIRSKNDFDDTSLHSQIVSFSQTYPTANIYAIVLCLEDVMKSVSQNLYMPLIILNLILDIQKHIHE